MDWRLRVLGVVVFGLATLAVALSNFSTPPSLSYTSQNPRDDATSQQSAEKDRVVERKGLLERTAEDPVALFTALLTIFTGLLFLATCGLWYMAVRQSGDAREGVAAALLAAEAAQRSAELSEKALLSGETPYLYPILVITPKGGSVEVDGKTFINDLCIVTYENYGNMTAIMYGARLAFEEGGGLPEGEFPFEHQSFFRMNKIIRNGEHSDPMRAQFDGHFYDQPMTLDDMKNRKMTFMSGAVWYSDFLGNHFLTRFCYGFSNYSHTALVLGGEKKNHRRRLTEAELASLKDREA